MARASVRDVSPQSVIQPVAAPVDSFISPARTERSPLHDLARGLSGLDNGLSAFLGKRDKKQSDADKVQGEDAFNKSNRQGWAAAVANGDVPAGASPVFQESYKNTQGNAIGLDLRRKWTEAYFNWEGKNSDDPAAFDAFYGQFLKENITTDDPSVLGSLNKHIAQLTTDAYNHHIKIRGQRVYKDAQKANSALIFGRLGDFNDANADTGKSPDHTALWDQVLKDRENAIGGGMRREDFDGSLVDAILTSAIEKGDADVLKLLDKTLPGNKTPLAQDPKVAKQKLEALNTIGVIQRRKMREDARLAKAKDKTTRDAITRGVVESLVKDPNFSVPEDIMKQWVKVDPTARVKFVKIRKTLLEGKGNGDPSAILDLHQKLREGAGPGAINEAVTAGIIRNRQEYAAAFEVVRKVGKSQESNSVVLKSRTATRFRKAIKSRTSRGELDPFGVKGMTDDGLKATQEFEDQLIDWEQAHPKATPQEREKAINEIGTSVLGNIGDTKGDLDKAGKFVQPPTESKSGNKFGGNTFGGNKFGASSDKKPVQQGKPPVVEPKVDNTPVTPEQKSKLGVYGGDKPPKLETLPDSYKAFIDQRAKKTGRSKEEINKRLHRRLQSLIKKSSFTPEPTTNVATANPRIINAMISAESGGDPSAESPTGASGIMQVQPNTAKDIAKELGDKNFPTDTSKIKAYLKQKAIGKAYGEHYMNKQLKTFKGDLEASLIAYNAGPGNARKWLKAGRDYTVLPKRQETQPYVAKIMRKLGSPIYKGKGADVSRYLVAGKAKSHAEGLHPRFRSNFDRMLASAPKEVRDGVKIFSGYRSVSHQKRLWKRALKKYGSAKAARKWVAPPGRSEHNHGRSADLKYASPAAKRWMHANAKKFGLHFRMSHEPWHISLSRTKVASR